MGSSSLNILVLFFNISLIFSLFDVSFNHIHELSHLGVVLEINFIILILNISFEIKFIKRFQFSRVMFFVMEYSGFVDVGELSESDVFLDGGFRILNVGSDDKRNDSDESDSHH